MIVFGEKCLTLQCNKIRGYRLEVMGYRLEVIVEFFNSQFYRQKLKDIRFSILNSLFLIFLH